MGGFCSTWQQQRAPANRQQRGHQTERQCQGTTRTNSSSQQEPNLEETMERLDNQKENLQERKRGLQLRIENGQW